MFGITFERDSLKAMDLGFFSCKKILLAFHGDTIVSDYFTQLTILSDDIQNFSPFPCCLCGKCTCNVNVKIASLQHKDLVMQLLIRLNESFAQVRGQILLMDPLLSLNKVYSLLIQEEKQTSIGIGNSNGPFVEFTTLTTKVNSVLGSSLNGGYKNQKKGKERPVCSHYGVIRHTVEKGYKIHGYPLGYNSKSKNALANKVSNIDLGFDSCA